MHRQRREKKKFFIDRSIDRHYPLMHRQDFSDVSMLLTSDFPNANVPNAQSNEIDEFEDSSLEQKNQIKCRRCRRLLYQMTENKLVNFCQHELLQCFSFSYQKRQVN